MKHGQTRGRLGEEYGVLCFEMEAAGLMNQLPGRVIWGICDQTTPIRIKTNSGKPNLLGM